MATYSRQCGSLECALNEIAEIRVAGRWASEPVKTLGPNRRTIVWEYSAEVPTPRPDSRATRSRR